MLWNLFICTNNGLTIFHIPRTWNWYHLGLRYCKAVLFRILRIFNNNNLFQFKIFWRWYLLKRNLFLYKYTLGFYLAIVIETHFSVILSSIVNRLHTIIASLPFCVIILFDVTVSGCKFHTLLCLSAFFVWMSISYKLYFKLESYNV